MVETLVEVRNLCKHFESIRAVDDVSFGVNRGEVLGFLGPNGAGKTTTMRIITGFIAADAGSVTIGKDDIVTAPVLAKRRIGYLPEGAPLYGDMTPRGFLGFVAEIRGFRGQEKERRIADTVEKTNLGSVLDQSIETLSKGFKRRVGLAQAILHDPEVLILDEPTDGLDPNQKHEVRTLIQGMAVEKAIILSTHILEEVDSVCSRAIVISDGRLVGNGTPAALRARSRWHNAVTLSVRDGDRKKIRNTLSALPGVVSVELSDISNGITRFVAYAGNGQSIVGTVSQAVREQDWKVEELYVEQGRLDDVFRAMTTGGMGLS
uniref:ABC-2 type transport system ATP-binding protein n=1 Tax=Candidatus Kentrum sp. MB TaxID=2138164 RepID=A0A450XH59_9GAMM|nr:MAG: ABC-2 type transport system ATP-binding protein [Candidatus Kentron sp. MB]VFK28606.1 MAG: ABC-2 type transport system ATP-binding protein [Candidatus Kentron sp. MB]VFK74325.1 MAG: ABC-2 type transport system ATP-binding protein [Candidatus Kentron sp. MB]